MPHSIYVGILITVATLYSPYAGFFSDNLPEFVWVYFDTLFMCVRVRVRARKINKYGFLRVNGKLAKHLGVEFGKDKVDVPVSIERIEGGFVVKVMKA